MAYDYDLIIIGAGWAGFNAAIKAKKSGLKAAIIEKGPLGGTCLNRGCIPAKALIQSAKIYSLAKKTKNFGVDSPEPKINFTEIQQRKEKIIQQLQQNIEFMLKGVDIIRAEAKISSPNSVKANEKKLTAKYIVIASGSKPFQLKEIQFDGKKIISSDEILDLKEAPKSLLIIGGGVIGCEFANLFFTMGSSVTVVEKMPRLLPEIEKDVARKLEVSFKKKGIKVNTNFDALGLDFNNYELVLLCAGRSPKTENLGLEEIGIALDKNKIKVDDFLTTNIPNIYAVGDCTGKIMLAHYAAYQGITAAENIVNQGNFKRCDNNIIPSCIFTDPEVASVGLDEENAAGKGFQVKINKFDFLSSGMARILDETEGFIKIISDVKSDKVLGASIIGPRAAELIGILTLAVSNSLTISQLHDTIFAHPTLSECIHEAL